MRVCSPTRVPVAKCSLAVPHATVSTVSASLLSLPPLRGHHRISAKEKAKFVKDCQPGVFRYDEASDALTVAKARKATNIDEIRKIGLVRAD